MQPQSKISYRGPSTVTPVVQALLIANGAIFLLDQLLVMMLNSPRGYGPLTVWFALWPLGTHFLPWQLLTYGFLHGSVAHIAFNMFALWMFGSTLERLWGSSRFLIYYLICIVGAAVTQLLVMRYGLGGGRLVPTVGASGGVFGLLLAFGMMYPNRMVMLIFPPIPMRAKYFVVLYGLAELWLGITGTRSGVAHFAHLGGMFFGFFLILYWQNRLPFGPRR